MKKPISIEQRHKIDEFLESIYPEAKKTAEDLVSVIDNRTQIRGFETMVASVTRFSDVINYVKNQAGKDNKKKDWALIAPGLLRELEKLEKKAEEIGGDYPGLILAIKMKLVRGWTRQISTHYLFQKCLTGR